MKVPPLSPWGDVWYAREDSNLHKTFRDASLSFGITTIQQQVMRASKKCLNEPSPRAHLI